MMLQINNNCMSYHILYLKFECKSVSKSFDSLQFPKWLCFWSRGSIEMLNGWERDNEIKMLLMKFIF